MVKSQPGKRPSTKVMQTKQQQQKCYKRRIKVMQFKSFLLAKTQMLLTSAYFFPLFLQICVGYTILYLGTIFILLL